MFVPSDGLFGFEGTMTRLYARKEECVVCVQFEVDTEVGRELLLMTVVLQVGLLEEVDEGSLREVALERRQFEREEQVEVRVLDIGQL